MSPGPGGVSQFREGRSQTQVVRGPSHHVATHVLPQGRAHGSILDLEAKLQRVSSLGDKMALPKLASYCRGTAKSRDEPTFGPGASLETVLSLTVSYSYS